MAAPDITDYTLQLVQNGAANAPSVIIGDNQAEALVTAGWSKAQSYASNAFQSAQAFLGNLSSMANSIGTLPTIDTNLPSLDIDIRQFDYLLANSPLSPGNNFVFNETIYSSNLLTDLRAQLLAWVDGVSTGLAPAVEQAIWDRARSREAVNAGKKSAEAIRTFATRGFSKPSGALSQEIQDALQEAQSTNSSFSRDVAIKQADLEQSNRRFSMELAWKIEEGAISYMNQQMTRMLEAAKTLQQFYVEVYQADVQKLTALVQEYAARVGAETTVFRAKIDEAVAEANIRVEVAKANIQVLIQRVTLLLETTKAGAQVSSQLAASALSSVNLSGGLHSSVNFGATVSDSRSNSSVASVGATDVSQYSYTP